MKKFYFLLAALVVVIMTSCVKFKTEATVDVEVLKAGKDPSDVAGVENSDQATFFFCTYDAEGTRNGIVMVSVKTGDKKTVQLNME